MVKKIYLSPSNQRSNPYATGGTNEMAQCDKIANATASALKRCGFEVKVGKSGDTMQNRCTESDNFKADIHMPIHTNAYNGKVTGGTLVMVYKNSTEHNKAGKALLDAVGKISPGGDYSLSYRTDLYELSTPAAMTLYLEVAFHDTATGANWIIKNTTAIGEAICKGLCHYFGVTYKSAGTTENNNSSFKSYVVRITASDGVNIRKAPGTNSSIVGAIPKGGAYTIVAESNGTGATKWGKLKSGAGWIALDYTEKI